MSILRMTEEQYAARLARKPAKTVASAPPAAPKPSKYRNKPTDGYASKKEAKRAAELKLMESGGLIKHLRDQVAYQLISPQYRDGKCVERGVVYKADFVYWEGYQPGLPEDSTVKWRIVVEDSKGVRTADYILKRKMMLYFHDIRIRET